MDIAGTTCPGPTGHRFTRRLGALLAAVLLAGCAPQPGAGSGAEAGADPDAVRTPPVASTAPADGGPGGDDALSASVPPGECPSSGVLVRAGAVDAALGLRAMRVELVNCGTVPYTVNGYPGVRVLDDARVPLDVTIVNGSSAVALIDDFDTAPAPVTAGPGERLVAGLVWRNTVTDAVAAPVNGTYLEIVPARDQPPQTVRPFGRVDLGTTGRLGVTAWGRSKR